MQGEFRWPIVAERRSDLGLRDEFEEDEEEESVVEWKTERKMELIEIPDGLARRFITLAHNRPVFPSPPVRFRGHGLGSPAKGWWRELSLSSRYSFLSRLEKLDPISSEASM